MSSTPIIDQIIADLVAEGKIPANRSEAKIEQRLRLRCRRRRRGSYNKKEATCYEQ